MTLQPVILPGLFTEQVSTAHFISACSRDSQTGVSLIKPQKSPKPRGCIGVASVQVGKLKQKRRCKIAKKGSVAESELEGSCLIAKLFKYHNSKNRYHDTDIFNTPSLQKASDGKSFQNAQYWPHVQKYGAKKDCLLLSRHLLIFVTPE